LTTVDAVKRITGRGIKGQNNRERLEKSSGEEGVIGRGGKGKRGGREREGEREGEEKRTVIAVTWWSIQQASLGRSDSNSLEEFRVHKGELNHLSGCEVCVCLGVDEDVYGSAWDVACLRIH